MKKRVIWKMLVLSIFTLGIYRLYWFVKTRKEMMRMNPKIKIMTPWFLILPVIIVMIAVGFFIFSFSQNVTNLPSYCNTYSQDNSLAYTSIPEECQSKPSVWPIVSIYAAFILVYPLVIFWLWGYSKGVELVTKGKTSFPIAMIVLLLVPDGIDILVIQDAFNKLQ